MAGSSMDGIDLAYMIFNLKNNEWNYRIEKCETIPYEAELFAALKNSITLSFKKQQALDVAFGNWISEKINIFKTDLGPVDLLGVHGHTVVHEPLKKISWQLGDGQTIATNSGTPTVTDFRTVDINHGGQGAPLVPFGDFQLFKEYDACLNLGGIANVSNKKKQTAWDICPCNQVLNFFSNQMGFPYDDDGMLARQGSFDKAFYELISSNAYFSVSPPKSLPNNYLSQTLLNSVKPMEGLHTYTHIIVDQIAKSLPDAMDNKVLITGGGARNTFLIELLDKALNGWDVVVPDTQLIDFKESIVFAFLALKRFRNEINVHSSVTGASKDTSSGVIHLP